MAQRGAYAKGVAKREEILTAALAVIAREGYRGASVRMIADEAGLSPAGLLHYFDGKEELFVEILRARDERDTADQGLEEAETLSDFLSIVRHNATVPGLVQLYAQQAAAAGDPEHPARRFFLDRTERLDTPWHEVVQEAQAAGEIRDDVEPEWVVRTLHALADGLQSAWLLDSSIDMAAHLERFLILLRPTGSTGAQEQPGPLHSL